MTVIRNYYLSGITQNFWIGLCVVLLWIFLGNDLNTATEEEFDLEGGFLLYITSSLLLGSIFFYFIFTKLKKSTIRYLYGIILFAPFLVTVVELTDITTQNIEPLAQSIFFLSSVVLLLGGLIFSYVYISGNPHVLIRNGGIIVSSVMIARIMSLFFDLRGIIFFALLISIFDIYSVFRGPISRVMGKPQKVDNPYFLPSERVMLHHFRKICKDGTPVLFSYQNTILGIGDVLFFGILLFYGLTIWGIAGFALTLAMISFGSSITLLLLQRRSPLPGLPLPVFAALLGFGILFTAFGI